MDSVGVLSGGLLASLVIEAIKWAFIYFKKDPNFEFPAKFYAVAIPVLSFAAGPVLAFLGVAGFTVPTDWASWGKQLLVVGLTSLAAIVEYHYGIKNLSDYGKQRLAEGKFPGKG